MVKCEKKALSCRLEGNKRYLKKKFEEAADFYDESIRSCQFGDSHYFYALGNKSALLFETNKFKQSKDMIDFMFAADSFSILFGSDQKFIQKLDNRLHNCNNQLKLRNKVIDTSEESTATNKESSACFDKPFVNSALSTKSLSNFGYSVVTSVDLKPNETIHQMEPFTAVLGVRFWTQHCYTCFKYVKDSVVVPCDGCSEVEFCSISCCEENTIHLVHECPCIGFVKEIGLFHLVVKILLKFHVNKKLDDLIEMYETNNKVNSKRLRFSEHELQIISLCSSLKMSQHIRKSSEKMLLTIFKKLFSDPAVFNSASEVFIRTMSAMSSQMMMNASSIMYYDKNSCSNVAIGSGVYPAIAMMNHSCYSNTVCLYNGSTATVKTTQNIVQGSQLFNSYGFDFESFERSIRQENLKTQYDFDCRCLACILDWKRNDHVRVIVCQSCSSTIYVTSPDSKCAECSFHVGDILSKDVTVLEELYNEAFNHFLENNYKRGLEILTCCDSMERMKILHMPDSLLIDWNDLVKKFIIRIFNEER
jgi:hypothetical protein